MCVSMVAGLPPTDPQVMICLEATENMRFDTIYPCSESVCLGPWWTPKLGDDEPWNGVLVELCHR